MHLADLDNFIDKTGDCHTWLRCHSDNRAVCYPTGEDCQRYVAHVIFERDKKPIPKGMFVLHHCDNMWCVNSAHLFLGTQAENMQDKADKGRVKGSNSHLAKLDESMVIKIRADKRTHQAIADDYGVSRPNITLIKNRTTWTHI